MIYKALRICLSMIGLALVASPAMAAPLTFTVNLDEAVTVNTGGGTPRIALDIGGVTRYATYASGSGSANLTFSYSVQAGDFDADGIAATSPIELNGGTIRDAAGNDANLTFTPPSMANVKVQTTTVNWTTDPIDDANETAAAFEITKAPTGASYNYSITSDGGGTPVTGSGSIAGSPQTVTGIDVSGLTNGTLTASVTITNLSGTGSAKTDTVTKNVAGDPCVGSPSPGDVCADGSVYAGLSPDGNVPMYVTRCDLGQTWDGSACVGTHTLRQWNDGSTNWLNTPLANCTSNSPNAIAACNTGKSNSAFLNTADSSSAAGTQPHLAAQACESLNIHGKDDWYLPAQGELYLMWQNRLAIDNFLLGGQFYWSSSEHDADHGRSIRFSDGFNSRFGKNDFLYVRCARR